MRIYRAKHRRAIVTDNRPHWEFDVPDVQPQAKCSEQCSRGVSVAMCPRHDAVGYADHMARHATDSIGPLMTVAQDRAAQFHNYGVTR